MKDAAPQTINLADYQPPAYLIDAVHLSFRLDPKATRVRSRITFRANPDGGDRGDLVLDGENLKLISARIDDSPLNTDEYLLTEIGLTVPAARLPGDSFTWEAEVEIAPEDNTALEGLYMSNGMYCTQCEAEGFRKITYYPDRPDVMAPFTVTVESALPVMLSNGNPQDPDFARNPDGNLPVSATTWHDPWPKPAYLFALVAGDLRAVSDRFTTMEAKDIALNIWVRLGDEDRCAYAMDALKRSMTWDEQVYRRAYDLEMFNIVAVDDFNMGAMENKGLNVFNSKFVLASPETATDRDFDFIERIIAHEYFHNWTGNRITCRDWFQLCLKEGLTVFRDQQFSADMRSAPVKRIEDVVQLRARQFREDAGPLAHNVRPEHYVEINNFYTATVYEKGAEVIRMLRLIVGPDGYDQALQLYFDRHDGQACTIEDWLAVFEDATGRDLSQFKRWYSQAGTPRVTLEEQFRNGTYSLTLRQTIPPTPDQPRKEPALIPIAFGLLSPRGVETHPTRVIELADAETTVIVGGLAEKPVPSLLRGFSAPVILDHTPDFTDRALLLAHDTDPFNRWEAGRSLARETLLGMLSDTNTAPAPAFLDGLMHLADDDSLDPDFRALALALPSEDDIAQGALEHGLVPDPSAIHATRKALKEIIGTHLRPVLDRLYDALDPGPDYSPDAIQAGKRALRNTALGLTAHLDQGARARTHYDGAGNMTDQLAGFACLLDQGDPDIAGQFHDQWQGDRLVMDKWFTLQVSHAAPDVAVATAEALTGHPLFDWKNPNRFRAVIGGLTAGNPAGFHDPSGAGYGFLADWLIRLDRTNPQTAARMSTAFETWKRYDTDRQALMTGALNRIAQTRGLSPDLTEMTARMLA
ncbi:aminopeptidase N [Rhodophyticola sp. CCM32]|uniref:aminopeptidase N n=1 Tax=Rhodophyticola sp. CCM32 TaxID=2916397 RepID=UPI00107FAA16|nr:aminopeptidase N [Rhodophyticola sp. CCM32]QBX99814.1 aminopeptidase N [Rhodophyticola sp. CCM32]